VSAPAASSRAPSPSARPFVALLAARAAFGAYYILGSLRGSPVPWYLPLEHRFELSGPRPVAELAMDWYGRTAVALACAAAVGGVAWLLAGRGRLARALVDPRFVKGLAHAGALVLLVDFAYFGWVLLHQTPHPLPIPAWYCPR
jgi:hypothetical protein